DEIRLHQLLIETRAMTLHEPQHLAATERNGLARGSCLDRALGPIDQLLERLHLRTQGADGLDRQPLDCSFDVDAERRGQRALRWTRRQRRAVRAVIALSDLLRLRRPR